MPAKLDLTGQVFGRLTVIKEGEKVRVGKTNCVAWLCRCECGNIVTVRASALRSGNTKSCGCLIADKGHEKIKDLTGQRFGRLTVISRNTQTDKGRTSWLCKCDCGNNIIVTGTNLKCGTTNSCGCYRKEHTAELKLIHGDSRSSGKSRLYKVWLGMKERCNNPNHISYYLYGGRGISVCSEWSESYETFKTWALNSGYSEYAKRGECTLDRIDVNGNYCPDNCRWVDMKTQCQNKR